jgi:predicted RNase H-like HicB family nuclease
MQFNIIIEKDEDGWFVATVPSLPGCHTQAQSLDDLLERIREAIALYLDVKGTPPVEELRSFVGVQIVDVEAC